MSTLKPFGFGPLKECSQILQILLFVHFDVDWALIKFIQSILFSFLHFSCSFFRCIFGVFFSNGDLTYYKLIKCEKNYAALLMAKLKCYWPCQEATPTIGMYTNFVCSVAKHVEKFFNIEWMFLVKVTLFHLFLININYYGSVVRSIYYFFNFSLNGKFSIESCN